MSESHRAVDGLGLEELRALVAELLEANGLLRAENVSLREEIARLKGLKGRPQIKPSGMEQASAARAPRPPGRRGSTRAKLDPEIKVIGVEAVPAGARFKGRQDYLVQDLIVRPVSVLYRRERWLLADGTALVAPLPAGVTSHFGPELKRFVLAQYHQGQTTMPRLLGLLQSFGLSLSKRQLVRLLTGRAQEVFLGEARDVLRAGLQSASWISVDDTGARHRAQNGVCTQIGNDRFTSFATTGSKSRLNFLELLNAGDATHLINDAALAYMRERQLSAKVIGLLEAGADKHFANRAAFLAHLDRLGIAALKVQPDPVHIATEGALWGNIAAQGRLQGTVIVSDGAGQFDVGQHALCWVHAERLVHKLDAFSEDRRLDQQAIRARIWDLYAGLKAYALNPTPQAKLELSQRFDAIFTTKTCFPTLNGLLKRLNAQKPDLLAVLERPDVPLHTNGSENDIRAQVTRRKVSGGTRSDRGRDCRDAFLSLMKTCNKHGIRFWDYLGARLNVQEAHAVPQLESLIRPAPA